jgi:hypothetical protein
LGSTDTLTRQLILANIGTAALGIDAAILVGANAQDFSAPLTVPASVSPGGIITATATFAPSASGPRSATLDVFTNGSPAIVEVPLNGVGVEASICVTPSPADFGKAQVAGTPVHLPLVITNCGSQPTQPWLDKEDLQGTDASDFTISAPNSSVTLAPAATLTFDVAFSAAVVGPASASVPLRPCPSCSAQIIELTGAGIDCQITFAPSTLSFGPVPDGSTVSKTLSLSNTGAATCDVTSISTQDSASPFTVTGAPPIPLAIAPGQSVQIPVAYSPLAGSPSTDSLIFVYLVDDPAVPPRNILLPLSGG